MRSYRRRGRGSECIATGGEGEVVSAYSYRRRGRGSVTIGERDRDERGQSLKAHTHTQATGGEGEVVSV